MLLLSVTCLLGLVGLGAQARGSRGTEVAAEHGRQEGPEDDVGTTGDTISKAHAVGEPGKTYRVTGRDSHSKKTNLKV